MSDQQFVLYMCYIRISYIYIIYIYCVRYKHSIFPACSLVCRFVLPALLWIATEIIEDLPNVQEVNDVHSISI